MKKIFIIMFLLIVLNSVEAIGADWKYLGGAKLVKGEVVLSYYDTESVKYLPNKNVRVWIKGVKSSEVERIRKKNEKQIIEKSAKKVANGYFLPYASVTPGTSFDDYIEIIAWEEVATYSDLKPRLKIFWEINCTEKKIKTLTITSYNNDGVPNGDSKDSDWEYIPPESNSETLEKILCNGIEEKIK